MIVVGEISSNIEEEVAANRVAAHVEKLGLEPAELSPEYSYFSLPLCVVDAVYSISVKYRAVQNTVCRFCNYTGWANSGRDRYGNQPGQHKLSEFIEILNGKSPEAMAKDIFGNRQRTSSRNGILKAEACVLFTTALLESGIDDFRDISDPRVADAQNRVLAIPGQRSGISFKYFRMLAGDDSLVNPGRMVQRFVERATGEERINAKMAGKLVQLASDRLSESNRDWTPCRLDHTIWQFERATGEKQEITQ